MFFCEQQKNETLVFQQYYKILKIVFVNSGSRETLTNYWAIIQVSDFFEFPNQVKSDPTQKLVSDKLKFKDQN